MQKFVAFLYRTPAVLMVAFLANEAEYGLLGTVLVTVAIVMLLRLSFYVEYKDKF